MSFWRSSGSRVFVFCAISLVATVLSAAFAAGAVERGGKAEKKEENHAGATVQFRVTLEGVTSYRDFLELKTGLLKTEGVERLVLETEAPGLITLSVRYAGEPMGLIDKLSEFFPQKYVMKEKRGGDGTEISITPR